MIISIQALSSSSSSASTAEMLSVLWNSISYLNISSLHKWFQEETLTLLLRQDENKSISANAAAGAGGAESVSGALPLTYNEATTALLSLIEKLSTYSAPQNKLYLLLFNEAGSLKSSAHGGGGGGGGLSSSAPSSSLILIRPVWQSRNIVSVHIFFLYDCLAATRRYVDAYFFFSFSFDTHSFTHSHTNIILHNTANVNFTAALTHSPPRINLFACLILAFLVLARGVLNNVSTKLAAITAADKQQPQQQQAQASLIASTTSAPSTLTPATAHALTQANAQQLVAATSPSTPAAASSSSLAVVSLDRVSAPFLPIPPLANTHRRALSVSGAGMSFCIS